MLEIYQNNRFRFPIFWAPFRAFRYKSSAKSAVAATAGKELLPSLWPLAPTGVLASGLFAPIAGAAPRACQY
ncbi:MAG: hypothetical protein EA358_05830 [Flavobacteriales bacterium]|nr:MAG: hypothetical protein EA358_05830 [Flavobacteriales bacterium]